jgi:hypothetical protein
MHDGDGKARSPDLKHRPGRRAPPGPREAPLRPYDRRAELPRVLPLWPHELDDETREGRRCILGRLRRALRAERQRGLAGHWTDDLARHAELARVYRLELAASRGLERERKPASAGGFTGARRCCRGRPA